MPPDGTAWRPESLVPVFDEGPAPESFAYVMLEEIVDGQALLLAWAWPRADEDGRVFWPPAGERPTSSATIAVQLLRQQLYEGNDLRREPRCGDTFAVGSLGRGGRLLTDLRRWLTGPVYDISADTLEAARIAYRSAVAAVSVAPPDPTLLLEAAVRRQARAAPRLRVGAP